jgi:hypothetical protein
VHKRHHIAGNKYQTSEQNEAAFHAVSKWVKSDYDP